jgi:hypothetical protein
MEHPETPEVLKKLTYSEVEQLLQFIDKHVETTIMRGGLLEKLAVESVRSQQVNESLRVITAKTGTTPEKAMIMALALYEVAIDAISQDQRLVLVDKEYGFVREITGVLEKKPNLSSHDKVAG